MPDQQNDATPVPVLLTGVAAIERTLATLPLTPGVYRMLDAKGDALYIGKARSLRKRVYSYTQIHRLPERLRRMVLDTVSMEIVTTHTEAEALLLEANLIKRLKPRFNIVLRDDKSYPWLMLTEDHEFPQIVKHRGARTSQGESYWGPFASAWAVNQTVTAMQRVFLLRSCTDTRLRQAGQPALPAVSDPPLLGALCRTHRCQEGYASTRGPGTRLSVRQAGGPAKGAIGRRDGDAPQGRSSSSAQPRSATASAALPMCRAAR